MVEVSKDIDGLRSLSQLFSAANLKRIVIGQDLSSTKTRLKKYVNIDGQTSYNKLYKEIYKQLFKNYRNEYFYKNALLNKVVLGQHSLNTTTVLNELRIGTSCADFVFLNGEVRIYEIKTELDDLTKLKKQLDDYSKFSNKVYVVASPKHSAKLLNSFKNSRVGIIQYTDRDTLCEIKKAENLNQLDHTTIFKTLRKTEYMSLIMDEFGYLPEVPNTRIFRECLKLAQEIKIERFQFLAMNQLKRRRIQCPENLYSSNTPTELKFLCHTMDLDDNEYLSLYSFLKETV